MRVPHLTIFLVALIVTDAAYGYIDPGPSNLIIQFLIAMGAGSLFFVKRVWNLALGYFSPQRGSKAAETSDTELKVSPKSTTKPADEPSKKNKTKRTKKAA